MTTEKIKIFYSWQSDLPKEMNINAIRNNIKSAVAKLEEDNDCFNIMLDEATRDTAGSPSIPSAIFEKIYDSDIFIVDVSIINHESSSDRKTPNPNVLIELGYAIAKLGWERIILIFNEKYGKIEELPFDIRNHRALKYKINDKNDNNGKVKLKEALRVAIKTICDKNPIKPTENTQLNLPKMKRDKDIQNLIVLFNTFHLEGVQDFIDMFPEKTLYKGIWFYEQFNNVYKSPSFHIYDEIISNKLYYFFTRWDKLVNQGAHYFAIKNSEDYEFNSDEDTKEKIRLLSSEANVFFRELILEIRKNWIEVDIDERSKEGFEKYLSREAILARYPKGILSE